jgi:formate dehydrogenase major subunit
MRITRRDFLKASGATACVGCSGLFGKLFRARADATRLRIRYAQQTTSICPYCGCGCGLVVSASGGKVINIEGDPDHPVNRGSLCSKGGALYQVANNPRRLTKVKYRAPGSDHWDEVSWNWALERISYLAKKTRDEELSQVTDPKRTRVNSIAAIGGASLDTEECYVYSKLMRALGVVYIEHQARI